MASPPSSTSSSQVARSPPVRVRRGTVGRQSSYTRIQGDDSPLWSPHLPPLGQRSARVKIPTAPVSTFPNWLWEEPAELSNQPHASPNTSAPSDLDSSLQLPPSSNGPVRGRNRAGTISQRLAATFEADHPVSEFGRPRSGSNLSAPSTSQRPRIGSVSSAGAESTRPASPPAGVQVRILGDRSSHDTLGSAAQSSPIVGSGTSPVGDGENILPQDTPRRRRGNTVGRKRAVSSAVSNAVSEEDEHHNEETVDLLEVVDPAVHTASTLYQIQSAIFAPSSYAFFKGQRPIVDLEAESSVGAVSSVGRRRAVSAATETPPHSASTSGAAPAESTAATLGTRPKLSPLDEDGELVSRTESELLDDHVKMMVKQYKKQQRKEKLKGFWKGFLAFAKTPLGVVACIYGFLVVVWGAALVLLLMLQSVFTSHHTYQLWVEISSQILTGLFTVPAVLLFPSRCVDWWHASIILHYAKITWRRRSKRHLAPLPDKNDLPDPCVAPDLDTAEKEVGLSKPKEVYHNGNGNGNGAGNRDDENLVLNEKEMARLRHAQTKLCQSQTWYRPHATPTHHAFPIKWTVIILLCNIWNSLFQFAMCGVMWGLRYYNRPAWTTGIFMPGSFLAGIAAAIFIWQIGKRTHKHDEVMKHVEEAIAEEERDEQGLVGAAQKPGQLSTIVDNNSSAEAVVSPA